MQAATLLEDLPNPSDAEIEAVMAGSLCRCMAYVRIRKAIKMAAAEMQGLPAAATPDAVQATTQGAANE
jgi:isoquinoline 1-oxidoreductase alpha subunit